MLAPRLRKLAASGQYGHARTPDNFYMTPDYCAFYWSNAPFVGIPDHAIWQRVAALSARYLRYVAYVREVAPNWTEVARTHFADNSVEATQRARDGRERTVMLVAPHGDLCF